MSRRSSGFTKRDYRRLPANVKAVLRDFPGISLVRAQQVARDRQTLLRRAQRQARHNLYGELTAGGIGPSAHALLESLEHVGNHPSFLETYEFELPGDVL